MPTRTVSPTPGPTTIVPLLWLLGLGVLPGMPPAAPGEEGSYQEPFL